MVLDTSALLAILYDEPERDPIARAIDLDPIRLISAPTVLEATMVILARYGNDGQDQLDLLMSKLQLEVVDFTSRHLAVARQAYARFGKGRHPARLNYGDCISYALAISVNEALLFKGQDFARTDVRVVSY